MRLRRAADGDDLVAAEHLAALARGEDSPDASAGALLAVEALKWLIAIGRGLSGGR